VSTRFAATWVREIESAKGPGALLAACRRAVRSLIVKGVSKGNQPLFLAVLLGERVGLPPSTRDAFGLTGTAHLLSISGLHVGLIAAFVLFALRLARVSPTEQRVGVLLALVVYLVVVGPRVPTLRATVAGVIFFTLPGRGDAWNRLALAALVVLAWDPSAPWSVGFQLSFGTVAGILAMGPVTLRLCRRVLDGRPRAAGVLAGVIVCFFASAPLLGLCFGAVPLVALVIGAPSVAIFSLLLALGLVASFVGVVSPQLGVWIFSVASSVADLLVWLVEGAARVPGASLDVIPAAGPAAVLGTGLLALGAARGAAGARVRWPVGLGAAVLVGTLIVPGSASVPVVSVRNRGRTVVVDSGHGSLLAFGAVRTGRWLQRVRQDRRRASVEWCSDDWQGSAVRSQLLSRGISLISVGSERVLLIQGDPPLRAFLSKPLRVDVLIAGRVSARNAERLRGLGGVQWIRRRDAVDVQLHPEGPLPVLR
jgi:ComEC/Rec2-related protein